MIIIYKNKDIKKIVEDKKLFNKKYGDKNFDQFEKAIKFINIMEKLSCWKKYPSLRLEKKRSCIKNIGIFRINQKIRVEFIYDSNINFLDVKEIKVIKIHQHKYKK